MLTDNGSCYKHWLFRKLLHRQHIKHRLTRPYTPRTNGKAERFIQTALREWAYARSYQNSEQRTEQLELWMHDYNFHRPHVSLKLNSPASRSGLNRNNLLSLHSYSVFGIHVDFFRVVKGGFFLRKKPLECFPSVYSNSENAIGFSSRIAPVSRAQGRVCGGLNPPQRRPC